MQNDTEKLNISSNAVNSMANNFNNYVDVISRLENTITKDAGIVQILMQRGIINQEKGRDLISHLANKLNEISAFKNIDTIPQTKQVSQPQEQNAASEAEVNYLDIFTKENPDFFKGDGRNAVLDYIKNLNMDKDEIDHVAKLVETLENSAVDSYMKKKAHEKSLNDENAIAKSRLTAYAQNTASGNDYDRIFTREDIGNMSGDEFNKNEKLIMEQVKKGLIK